MPANIPVSDANAAHYTWGPGGNPCDGWHLVRTPELSVILERMPPGTSEVRHYHVRARQFFFVLEGELTIAIEREESTVDQQQGIEVAPQVPHQVFNRSSQDVRFLVISQPPSHGDRRVIGRWSDRVTAPTVPVMDVSSQPGDTLTR
jgi:mannose-6-phosphate isomerase-like protein (cupin superfamily)